MNATTADPVVIIGRCATCKRPFRIDFPADIAARHPNYKHNLGYYLENIARIPIPTCNCRKGVRCPEKYGTPQCGNPDCKGHARTYVNFTPGSVVQVTYKEEETCGDGCWTAKSSKCACSCKGKNHGGAHAYGRNWTA